LSLNAALRLSLLRRSPHAFLFEQQLLTCSGGSGGGGDQEYYLQCGVAIRTIRDEFPQLFEREMSFDIFRPDVAFADRVGLPGVPGSCQGLQAYKRVYWSLRLHRALFFSRAQVAILRIWQPRDRTLAVRWSIAATPRLLGSLGASDVHWDGVSEYKLDAKGMIYEHTFESVDWGDPPLAESSLARLLAGLGARRGVLPTPSFFAVPSRAIATAVTAAARLAGGGAAARRE
jgi:hypothetical protein